MGKVYPKLGLMITISNHCIFIFIKVKKPTSPNSNITQNKNFCEYLLFHKFDFKEQTGSKTQNYLFHPWNISIMNEDYINYIK